MLPKMSSIRHVHEYALLGGLIISGSALVGTAIILLVGALIGFPIYIEPVSFRNAAIQLFLVGVFIGVWAWMSNIRMQVEDLKRLVYDLEKDTKQSVTALENMKQNKKGS